MTKVDLVCLALIHLPELVWYILGNIIIYSGDMNECVTNDPYFYWSVFAIIVYGYVFMIGVLLTLLAALAIYCYFKTQTVYL